MPFDFSLPDHGQLNNGLEGLFLMGHLQDWAQTRKASRDPNHYRELNSDLGDHPSQDRVNLYMALRGLGHYGLSQVLPDEIAVPLQIATLAQTYNAVQNNRKSGMEINKPLLGAGALGAYLLSKNGGGTDNNGVPEGVKLYDDKNSKANFKIDSIDGAPGGRVNFYW